MTTATHARTASPFTSVLGLAPDVACLQLSIVNVYLVGQPQAGDRQWVLVDAGLPSSGHRIRKAAAERFGAGARPTAIVLTHGHFDHVGALIELAEVWDAPVYVHRLEQPYVTGRSSYPPPDPAVGGGGMAYLSFLYPRGPIDLGGRARELPEDGTLPGMPGWRWIHTPGHTPGHVSLFREEDRLLIAGDAFVTTYQESLWGAIAQPQHVWRPPAYFTPDWASARRSVESLMRLYPDTAATGHGRPMGGVALREQLRELVEHFDELAMPRRGRYAHQPAVADERGVRYVPPAATERQKMVVLGLGALAVGLGVGLLARRRRR